MCCTFWVLTCDQSQGHLPLLHCVGQPQWGVCAGLGIPISQSRDNTEMDMKSISTFLEWTALPWPCSSQFKISFSKKLETDIFFIPQNSWLLLWLWMHLAPQLLPFVIPTEWQELKVSLTQSPMDFCWWIGDIGALWWRGPPWHSTELAGLCDDNSTAT